MILSVDTPILLPMVMQLAAKVEDIPFLVLREMLLDSLNDHDACIFLDKKEKTPRGFMFATVEKFDGRRVAFIHLAYVSREYSNRLVCSELLNRVRAWARDRDLEYVYMATPRSPASYVRKYKFELVSHVLRRRA